MNRSCAILLGAAALVLSGCASVLTDPLEVAYAAGEISEADYQAACLQRDEALARDCAAHWELQQTFSQHRAKLPAD